MLWHRPDLGLFQRYPLGLLHGHGAVGEEVALLEFPGGSDDLLRGFSGLLNGLQHAGYGLLFGERGKGYQLIQNVFVGYGRVARTPLMLRNTAHKSVRRGREEKETGIRNVGFCPYHAKGCRTYVAVEFRGNYRHPL